MKARLIIWMLVSFFGIVAASLLILANFSTQKLIKIEDGLTSLVQEIAIEPKDISQTEVPLSEAKIVEVVKETPVIIESPTQSSKKETVVVTNTPTRSIQTPGVLLIPPAETVSFEQQSASSSLATSPEVEISTTINTPSSVGALNQSDIIRLTNEERAREHLPALAFNKQLSVIAEAKAVDMIDKQYFAHVSPSGVDIAEMAKIYGYEYINIGENLALGDFVSSREVVTGWMNSPGHRANIMNSKYTEIGVGTLQGMYNGRTVWYAVQEFGRPLSDCALPSDLLKQKIVIYQEQLDTLAQTLNTIKLELEAPGIRPSIYNAKANDYNTIVELNNQIIEMTKSAVVEYNQMITVYNRCVGAE